MLANVSEVLHLVIADVAEMLPVIVGAVGGAQRGFAVFDERLQHLWSNRKAEQCISSLVGEGGSADPADLFTSSGVLPRWQRSAARSLGAAAPEFVVVVLERESRRMRTVVIPALDPDLALRAMVFVVLEEEEEPEALLGIEAWQPLLAGTGEAFLLCDGSGRLVCRSEAVQRYFGEPVVGSGSELPYQSLLAAGEGVPLLEAHRFFLSGNCVCGQAETALVAVDGTTRRTVVRWLSCAVGRFPIARIDVIATSGIAIGSAEITETEIDRSEIPAESRPDSEPELASWPSPAAAVTNGEVLTARRLEQVLASRDLLIEALSRAGGGMLVLDRELAVIAANHDAAAMLGTTAGELAGRRLDEVLEPAPCELLCSTLEQACDSEQPLCGVLDGTSRFGAELALALTVEASVGLDGGLRGYIVSLLDERALPEGGADHD